MAVRYSRTEVIDRLRRKSPAVLPSLLLCDFGNLENEVVRLTAAGVAALHFDVMDGHFAPNLTYGMPIIASLRDRTDLVFDVHLMIDQPARYVPQIYEAGADMITIHAEAVDDARPVLEQIHKLEATAGLAINPTTQVSEIEYALPFCDVVLVMSVDVGFGGQDFNEMALEKLATLSQRDDLDLLLEVDGGVNVETVGHCAEAGANLFVAGSAIFRSDDYTQAVRKLVELAQFGANVKT